MEISKDRMQLIANFLRNIKLQLMLLDTKELEQIIEDASRDEAIGPMIDPTRWRDEDMFTSTHKMKTVLRMIIELKKELETK